MSSTMYNYVRYVHMNKRIGFAAKLGKGRTRQAARQWSATTWLHARAPNDEPDWVSEVGLAGLGGRFGVGRPRQEFASVVYIHK